MAELIWTASTECHPAMAPGANSSALQIASELVSKSCDFVIKAESRHPAFGRLCQKWILLLFVQEQCPRPPHHSAAWLHTPLHDTPHKTTAAATTTTSYSSSFMAISYDTTCVSWQPELNWKKLKEHILLTIQYVLVYGTLISSP